MSQANNLWEVEIDSQIYQADEDTLKYWLIEGRVKPTDKVRKKGQDWVEIANLVKLKPSNATNNATNQQPSLIGLEKAQIITVVANNARDGLKEKAKNDIEGETNSRKVTIIEPVFYHQENWDKYLKITCQYHPELHPEVLCPECGTAFCKHCADATHVGGGYKKASECIECGALCRDYLEIKEKLLALTEQKAEFGWTDLKIALLFPLSLELAPIVVFTVLSAFTAFAFPAFITIALLSNAVINAVKDAAVGEKEARNLDYTAFLGGFLQPLLVGLGAILIILAPLLASVVGTLKIFSILAVIGLIWAIIYYPIAILVAGLTENFVQVVNFRVGFEAVSKMGKLYKKFFGYFFLLEIPLIILYLMLPGIPMIEQEGLKVPNILAIVGLIGFIGLFCGIPFFYLSVAMGALVGRAVFKSANNLGLMTRATTKL